MKATKLNNVCNPQYPGKMKALKKYGNWLAVVLLGFAVSSCASYSELPSDDVYYSRNTNNPGEYNWEDFQKNAQSYGTSSAKQHTGTQDDFEYSSNYKADATTGQENNGDYQYIDKYYDSDYSTRLQRFDDNGGSNRNYYDDYYTGGSGYGYGSGSNFSMSLGIGMGYGYGYGYPYYGYPSYGYGGYGGYYGSSYMNGYWNGYWNGFYSGYYGGYYGGYPYYGGGYYPGYGGGGYYPGYGGGYYPDYGSPYVAYGPRGSATGGTTVPKSRGGRAAGTGGDQDNKSGGVVVAGRGTANTGNGRTTTSVATSKRSKPAETRPETAVRVRNQEMTKTTVENTRQDKLNKPASKTSRQPAPRYQKPKSYQSLPSRQPRSSK